MLDTTLQQRGVKSAQAHRREDALKTGVLSDQKRRLRCE
jgi:hypothetical protein